MRQALDNLGLPYGVIQVPYDRPARTAVAELTGQHRTPVLVDGGTVIWDSRRIVSYLYSTYGDEDMRERARELDAEFAGSEPDLCSLEDRSDA